MRSFALVPVLLLLAACGPSAEQSSPPEPSATAEAEPAGALTGVVWKWTGVRGADPVVVPHPSRYTLEFLADGRYSVRADCNSGSGTWSLEDSVLDLAPGPMTLVSCGPETLDRRYLQLLRSVGSFAVEDGRLRLFLGEGATRMEFDAVREMSLASSSWLVRASNIGHEAVVTVTGDLHVEFNEDGTVTGSAGCNRFNAGYTLGDGTLEIGPVATTRRACPDAVMAQEQAFLDALATVATWEIRGERAQLRTADGALAVDLVSAVTGTIDLEDDVTLPRGAVLRVQLLDTSRTDTVAPVLAEETIALDAGGLPRPFELAFDPAGIEPAHTYDLRATVSSGTDVVYTTTRSHPVITRGHARYGVELLLSPVGD